MVGILLTNLHNAQIWDLVLFNVVNPNYTATKFDAVQIICGKDCALLILVTKKSETLGFACIAISHKVYVGYFAILREGTDDVAFGEFIV